VGCKQVSIREGGEHTRREGGKWGMINKEGRIVIKAMYDKPIVVENRKARGILNGKTVCLGELGTGSRLSNAAEDRMPEELIREIHSIDGKAVDMAESVLRDPSLRNEFDTESKTLEERLMYLADELERIDSAAYETVADRVSEALLDLVFVQTETDMVSLRLGQVIDQQRAKALEDETRVPKDKE
jgi:hypothetical protein